MFESKYDVVNRTYLRKVNKKEEIDKRLQYIRWSASCSKLFLFPLYKVFLIIPIKDKLYIHKEFIKKNLEK